MPLHTLPIYGANVTPQAATKSILRRVEESQQGEQFNGGDSEHCGDC